MIFWPKIFFWKNHIFFGSFISWYYFVYILLRILCWFWIFNFLRFTFQYFGRYWQWKFNQNPNNAIFWARFALVTVFFGLNRLILVKAIQGEYWAAMLGSVVCNCVIFRNLIQKKKLFGVIWNSYFFFVTLSQNKIEI